MKSFVVTFFREDAVDSLVKTSCIVAENCIEAIVEAWCKSELLRREEIVVKSQSPQDLFFPTFFDSQVYRIVLDIPNHYYTNATLVGVATEKG